MTGKWERRNGEKGADGGLRRTGTKFRSIKKNKGPRKGIQSRLAGPSFWNKKPRGKVPTNSGECILHN